LIISIKNFFSIEKNYIFKQLLKLKNQYAIHPAMLAHTLIIPVILFFSYLLLCLGQHLGTAVPEMIGISGVVVILLAGGLMAQDQNGEGKGDIWSAPVILGFAIVFRLMFLWRMPELSDDIYRYIFDGMMSLSGHNPYGNAPARIVAATPEMASLIPMINHNHLPTIYPPAAQGVFAFGALAGGVFGMKTVMIAMDLATCIILMNLLKKLHFPISRAVLYAWHPLPVLEIGASGHIDGAAIFFLLAAFRLVLGANKNPLPEERSGQASAIRLLFAGVMAGFSVLAKWMPLVFIPGLLVMVPSFKKQWVCLAGMIVAGILLIWPFLPEFQNSMGVLGVYLQNWEFAGFMFRSLRLVTGSGETARIIAAVTLVLVCSVIFIKMAKTKSPKHIIQGCGWIAMAWLVCTPTLHPWYALYLAAFLPFTMSPVAVVFSWSVFLAYRVLLPWHIAGQWTEDDFTPFLIVSGPAMAFLAERVYKRCNHSFSGK